jgi:hypothetical protein
MTNENISATVSRNKSRKGEKGEMEEKYRKDHR